MLPERLPDDLATLKALLYQFVADIQHLQEQNTVLHEQNAQHIQALQARQENNTQQTQALQAEQQIWNNCARLVVNAIVYYNTLLLSKVYVQKLAASDMGAIEALHGISPIAWRHVNLVGRFDFTSDILGIDIDALVAPFSDPEYWRKALVEDVDKVTE